MPAPDLMALVRAIATRDSKKSQQLLAADPDLARQAVPTGATRQVSREFYFDDIGHYVYAGDTALHVAAAAHDRKTAAVLLAKGADPDARNRRGATPLHYAADGAPGSPAWNPAAQAETIEALIDAGADPDALDKSGVAPLHRAVRTRCAAAVKALIAKGADHRLKNKGGSTPLDLATRTTGRGGSGTPAAKEQQAQILALLRR